MRRAVWFSTFLFAVATVALLQTNTCTPAGNARLDVLELRVGTFQGENVIQGFDPDMVLYNAVFPESEAVGILWVRAQDASATIAIHHDGEAVPFNWDGMALLDVPLGSSDVTIKVSVDTGGSSPYSWTYRVRIQRGDLCEGVVCDDQNECTEDQCNPFNGVCEGTLVADGSTCAGARGRCYGGQCNYVPVSVSIGPKEVVFDWTTDRCEDLDLPDNNARFVRAADGELVLFSNNGPTNHLSRGPDFDALQRVCDPPALVSADLQAPDSYENWEWLWAPYRVGESWHVLIHDEFHDAVSPTCDVGNPAPGNPCWYNSITYAVSTDNAYTFAKPSPPAHVVAPPAVVWEPPFQSPPPGFNAMEGYFTPSNIVHAPDGYYYSMIRHYHLKLSYIGGFCPIRTATLGDPQSWRAWDGTGFDLKMESPYVIGEPVPACTWVQTNLTSPNTSLTYNTYLQRYMLVGQSQDYDTGVCRSGIWFSLSTDLIHWSDHQLLSSIVTVCNDPSPEHLEPVWVIYPSIIDHTDTTTNFERPGRTPYLYYTRMNGGLQDPWNLDRDLVRVPITFTMGGPLCEGIDCDDQNECTQDVCDGATGTCEHTPVEDGTACAEGRGGCYAGKCNFVPLSVTVGAREVVYDWTTDRCEDLDHPELLDIPDAPAKVVRAEDGELVLFSGNSWVSRGPGFNALQRVCDPPAFVTVFGDAPESYENQEWPWSPYREGALWHMLIHNEFHDAVAPTCDVGNPFAGNPCWYNSITYAVSTDNASTFTKPSPPAHVVAPAPNIWVPPPAPGMIATEGYFTPSNIVRGSDDFYYNLFMAIPVQGGPGGVCAMRTQTLNEPASWRAWDGTGFNLQLESPYITGTPTTACSFLPQNLDYILPSNSTSSLTYNTHIERYMLVFEAETVHGCGVHTSTSSDLVHWGELQFLIRAHWGSCSLDPNTPGNLEPVPIGYPSIIDHADSTVNFERPGQTPYLYYTRFNGGLDRDLFRVPLTFTIEE